MKTPIKIFSENLPKPRRKTIQYILGTLCKQKKLTLATVESCTGGLISKMITEIPGSSAYFKGGLTAYSTEIKLNVLGVTKKTVSSFGAISRECAFEMAVRAKKIFKTDFAVSTTGIAGPSGATPENPIGLVYFGLAAPKKTKTYKRMFKGERKHIQRQAATFALNLILKNIE